MCADPKNVHRILLRLEQEGIVRSEFRGKERYFSANREHPLYNEYKNLYLKTAGIEALFREKLRQLEGVTDAYIFGSYARGDFTAQSDLDILLIGRHQFLQAQKLIHGLQLTLGREVNLVQLRPEELEKKRKEHDQFIDDVFSRKVIKLI